MLENLLTDEDTTVGGGYSNSILEPGKYVFAVSSKIQATTTAGGKRKIKLGLRPVSDVEGNSVSGKFVNYKVEIDRVTIEKDGATKSWMPIGKLFGALGISAEEGNPILTAIQESFPSVEEINAAEYNTVDMSVSVNGEPFSFEGRKVAAEISTEEFNGNTYNAVKFFINPANVVGIAD